MPTLMSCIIVVTKINFSTFFSIVSVPPRLAKTQNCNSPRLMSIWIILVFCIIMVMLLCHEHYNQYTMIKISTFFPITTFIPSPRLYRKPEYRYLYQAVSKKCFFCDRKLCSSNQLLLATMKTQKKFQRSKMKFFLSHGPSKIPILGEMWEFFFLGF